ncbi:unnamed protein product, partial [Allacma fusca]
KYYKCKYPKTTRASILGAIRHVREGYSQREAAELYGWTRSVVQKYLKWSEPLIPEYITAGRFKPVFTSAQEDVIVAYAIELSERFYGMTR